MNFIIRLVITAVVAYFLPYIFSGVLHSNFYETAGVHFADFKVALIFAVVLALLNAFVKPIIKILAFPVTLITLGLFLFVINALIILLADYILDGMTVDGFWWALVFSVTLSIITSILNKIFIEND